MKHPDRDDYISAVLGLMLLAAVGSGCFYLGLMVGLAA